MTPFQTSIFLTGLLLWTGTASAQEESLDELLEGFEESPNSQEKFVDDLLGGFEESGASSSELSDGFEESTENPDALGNLLDGFEENSSIVAETDSLSLPTGMAGSVGTSIAYAYAQPEPNSNKPDYQGLRKLRLYLQLEYQYDLTPSTRFFADSRSPETWLISIWIVKSTQRSTCKLTNKRLNFGKSSCQSPWDPTLI